jgi:hypothetical protein
LRVESRSRRPDFDERRARALEGVVMYRPGAAAPLQPPGGGESRPSEGAGDSSERRTRRRRRRSRPRGDRGDTRHDSQASQDAPSGGASEAPQSDAGVDADSLADTSSDS